MMFIVYLLCCLVTIFVAAYYGEMNMNLNEQLTQAVQNEVNESAAARSALGALSQQIPALQAQIADLEQKLANNTIDPAGVQAAIAALADDTGKLAAAIPAAPNTPSAPASPAPVSDPNAGGAAAPTPVTDAPAAPVS